MLRSTFALIAGRGFKSGVVAPALEHATLVPSGDFDNFVTLALRTGRERPGDNGLPALGVLVREPGSAPSASWTGGASISTSLCYDLNSSLLWLGTDRRSMAWVQGARSVALVAALFLLLFVDC